MKMRSWMMVAAIGLGVVGSMVPSTADAAPPPGADEKARAAYLRARALMKEANALEKQADEEREAAKRAYRAAMKHANQVDVQADQKRAEARRALAAAGKYAVNEQRADGLRAKARSLLGQARAWLERAEHYNDVEEQERARAKAQRDAAAQLLANSPDAEMKKDAADLVKQAEQDEKDAAEAAKSEADARKKAQDLQNQARSLIAQANRLDPDGT